jgi:formylglycine-generating enzyme required for sulfatase activity
MSIVPTLILTGLVAAAPSGGEKVSLAWRLTPRDTFWVDFYHLQLIDSDDPLYTLKNMHDQRVVCRFTVLDRRADGSVVLEGRIESRNLRAQSNFDWSQIPDPKTLEGTTFRVTLDDHRRVGKIEGLEFLVDRYTKAGSLPVPPTVREESAKYFTCELSCFLEEIFYYLPGGTVAASGRWENTIDSNLIPGYFTKKTRRFQYQGPVDAQDATLHKIAVQMRDSVTVDESSPINGAGQRVRLTSTKIENQACDAQIVFDAKRGRPAQITMLGSFAIARTYLVDGGRHENRQVSKSTVTVRFLDHAPAVGGGPIPEAVAAAARSAKVVPPLKHTTNALGMKLVLLPPGRFLMGEPKGSGLNANKYNCQHEVELTRSFWIGAHEVTIGQYRRFVETTGYKTRGEKDPQGCFGYDRERDRLVGSPRFSWRNPGWEVNDNHPVVNLTYEDAQALCAWLSKQEGKRYRLPTSAEWEYACRAGTQTTYHSGDDPESLAQVANVADSCAKKHFLTWTCLKASDGYVFTAPVGSFRPNAFGLYDMHGNAAEWVQDYHWADDPEPQRDPQGPPFGFFRIQRGGSWLDFPHQCTSAYRPAFPAHLWGAGSGFRVVREEKANN